ncbi:MAG: FKBP-type peptidyl-prolyl cis-trans isomerase [Bacteroidales bacterium]
MKQLFVYFLTTSLFLTACNNKQDKGFNETDNGLEYKFHQQHPNNQKPKKGDVVVLNMMYETADGNVLFNSAEMDRTYLQTIRSAAHTGGSFEEALAMMHLHDSATFRINAHDFLKFSMKQENLPENIDTDDKIIIHIKLKDILQKDEYGNQITKNLHTSEAKEMELLNHYLKITNTTVEPDSSGMYIVHIEEGSGEKPAPGDIVTIHYTATYISGEPFETSLGKKPLRFPVGEGKVIKGLEIGVQQLKEGGKARLIIPSKLAYGMQGKDNIMPYSTLIFEIELINVD